MGMSYINMRSDREHLGPSQVFRRAVSPPKDRLNSVFTKKNIIIINENRDEIRYFKIYDYTMRKKTL